MKSSFRPRLSSLTLLTLGLAACSAGSGSSDSDAGSDGSKVDDDGITLDDDGSDDDITLDDGGDDDADGTGQGDPDEDCDATLELILRDFTVEHPDMQSFNGGQNEAACGIVMPVLDTADGKRQPTFQSIKGSKRQISPEGRITCEPIDPYYSPPPEHTGPAEFAQWYNNTEGVNMLVEHKLDLTPTGTGSYVYDSGQAGFFPLDGKGFNEESGHNFYFTTEAHVRFTYEAGQTFTFSGDDDLWIFVNDKLALDLGGLHMELTATIYFDEQAEALGISPGKTYNMDIFHAERYKDQSNFRVETNIGCFETVDVVVK